jgi:cobalamin biosynthesis protein CobD/CbiB
MRDSGYLGCELPFHPGVFSMHLITLLAQIQPDQAMVRHLILGMMAILPIIILLMIALVMVPCWFILKKAGFSPWLSLLCIFPSFGTLILLYVLAFAEWKVKPAPQVLYPPTAPTA